MKDLIYALDQRTLGRIVPLMSCESAECFDLIRFGDANTRVASQTLCGVNTNYLGLMNFAAPLVPYGIVTRRIPGRSLDDSNVEIALYKQQKKDRTVLSVGLSGSVLNEDLLGVSKFTIPAGPALGCGPMTYSDFPEIIDNAGHRIINDELKYYLASGPFHHGVLGFMRDGVKKPGYVGAAHICLPYLVEVRYDVVPKYFDKDKEFVGWFKPRHLMSIAQLQDVAESDPEFIQHFVGFADREFSARIGENALTPMEPWTAKLVKDYTFETVIEEKFNPEV